jgi:hypothetical protein
MGQADREAAGDSERPPVLPYAGSSEGNPPYDPGAPRTQAQSNKLFAMLGEVGMKERDDVLVYLSETTGRNIASTKDLLGYEMDPIFADLQTAIDGGLQWMGQAIGFAEPVDAEVVDDGPMFPDGVDPKTGEVT